MHKTDAIHFARRYDAVLTYGRVKHAPVEPFKPHYVRYDKVKLTFKAFFKQSVPESGLEHYRIRFVNIMYFMDDDTMTVIEPKVEVVLLQKTDSHSQFHFSNFSFPS